MIDPVLLLAGGFVASFLLGKLAIGYASRRNIVDLPGQRRSHVVPTPRGGGIAPVLVMLLGGARLAAQGEDAISLGMCLVGLAMVAGIGWMDDHRPLPALPRLAIHLLAAVAAGFALCGTSGAGWSGIVLVALVAMATTSLVNVWNFMDGIDGIAASQAALVLAAVLAGGWLSGSWQKFAWLALVAVGGFLPLNLPRARIFLGDVGSGALGYVVAVVLLRAVLDGGLPWPLALLPVGAFLVDAGMTLGKRVLQGKRWWRPHREHLYQWLVRRGISHGRVDVWYAIWTLAAAALALATTRFHPSIALLVSWLALTCTGLCWLGIRKRLWMRARKSH